MHFALEVWRSLTDPDQLIHLLTQVFTGWLGYGLLAGIVFAETGLLVGLFLPGDSLLFTVGVVAGAGDLDIVKISLLLVIASIAGDQSGYFLGRRTGPAHLLAPGFTRVQAGIRHPHASVLRQARRQDADLRQVRAHRAHLRALHGGRGAHAVLAVSFPSTFSEGWAGCSR